MRDAFLISHSMRKVKIRPGKPAKVKDHDYGLFILPSWREVMIFLNEYTDIEVNHNGDQLAIKESILESINSVYTIKNIPKFRNEVIGYTDMDNFHYKYYPEHYISVRRLEVGRRKPCFPKNLIK
jgi:hypothetical protein